MSDDANSLIAQWQKLWTDQGNFRSLWNTIAQFVMPAWDNFLGEFAQGVNRNTRIFDSTAIIANERFAACMEAMLTPRSQIWHKLKPKGDETKASPAVLQWFDAVNDILFAARYHAEANFASQTDECYMSLGSFGNNLLFVDEVIGRCLRYRSIPLSEIVWAVNHQGMVDSIFRKFKYTAKQAVNHWGKDRVPGPIQRKMQAGNQYDEFEFLHVVKPNHEYTKGSYGDKGKRYESWYIFLGDKSVLERGTYRTFPCAVGRYRVAPREYYGRGPGTTCLPDIRTANEMVKTGLRAGQKAVDPPILLQEESVLTNFNQRPGANNYGMVSSDGKALAVPFESKANFEVGEEQLKGVRSNIADAFLNSLWDILTERAPNETATEALIRAQEKGEMIAPMMGRQQSEFLGPCIHREFDILEHAKAFPPPPQELLMSCQGDLNQCFEIEYTSPMATALKAQEGSSIMNTVNDLATMANLDKTVLMVMDFHDAARKMARIRGTPADLLRSEDQVQALMEQSAQQAQEQQAADQAPQVAMGVKNLAQAAQAVGAGAGSPGASQVPA